MEKSSANNSGINEDENESQSVVALKPHARLSASGLGRIAKCPPSVVEFYDPETDYADEGTEFASWCEKISKGEAFLLDAPRGFQNYIETYFELLRQLGFNEAPIKHLEERLGDNEYGGTPDVAFITDDGTLVVLDIKFGEGVSVEVHWNLQLMSYADLMIKKYPGKIFRVKLAVWQPRDFKSDVPLSTWDVEKEDMKAFRAILDQAQEDQTSLKIIGERPEDFNAGNHCQFCKRKVACPVYDQYAKEIHEALDADVDMAPAEKIVGLLLRKSEYNQTLRDYEAYAFQMLKSGVWGPECGMKIITSYGKRQWKEDAEDLLKTKINLVDLYDEKTKKLRSAHQLKKHLKSKNALTDELNKFIEECVFRKETEVLAPSNWDQIKAAEELLDGKSQ